MKSINLVLFGDQAVENRSTIQALVRHTKTSAGARRLLQEATDLVQLHFGRLSKDDRAWPQEVHTLLGLAEDNITHEQPNCVIATLLMCIGRLGELIVYAEEDPSILGTENDRVQVLAFCTGLLPAAALVAARDTSELFEFAREIISITFRFSIAIKQRMSMVEDTNLTWAITLVGKTPEQVQPILDDFHRVKDIPYPKRIAIAVVSANWMTLIGAPSSLRRLMEFSKELEETPRMDNETKAAHTQFLPPFDLEKVLGDSPLLNTPITSKARILSPASCKPYAHETLRSLLAEIILDIAHRILRVDDTVDACISALEGKRPVSLTIAGPTVHLPVVERTLKSKNIQYQINQHHNPEKGIPSRGGSDLVAVVGMSARLPGSDTPDAFFETLLEGKIQLKKIPKTRFNLDKYYDPAGKQRHSTSTNQGAFLEHPGYFDNRLFNISPREALQMDPLQRMLLTTSREALEMAGYSKDATPSTQSNRIATYFGQAADDWRETISNGDIDIYYIPGLSRAFGPSRLAYHHKWGGGTYALDSACASSTTAIHLACNALTSRECDTALAGGGSLCVSPTIFAGLSKSGMISEHGGCRTYHDDADGYARGEGIGVVVLKRLEDAVAENDNILGIIRGHARTYTSTSTSITHPSGESQARLYEEVLRQTATAPNEIAYVEMHGTGTQTGDFEEMSSVIRVLGRQRSKNNVLTVGAVKANVGHGEAAAGVTSLIKVLMMMREKKIPPQPGLPFKLNRNFPKLDPLHVRIAGIGSKDLTLRPSPSSANGKIKCLVGSFDASGGNTSLAVEEAPERPEKADNPLPSHVVTLSARTPTSLQLNRKRLLDYLMRNPDTKLADLAYTTTARRMHEVLRVAYAGRSTKDIVNSLREDVTKNAPNDPKKKPPPMSVVFAFTGQGSQYAGMGRQLYQHSSAFQELLQTYQQMAEYQGLPRFLHLITDETTDLAASSAVVVQLALVTLEIATARLLKSWGVQPDLVIGHSLGEYSALCVAGVLSVSDTLYLVGRRAQLMEQKLTAGQYAMLAIGKDLETTRQLLPTEAGALSKTEVACINASGITVVSGPVCGVEHLKTVLEKEGSKSTVLRTPYGFHSHHIEAILGEFEAIVQAASFSAPALPVASTLLGRVVESGEHDIFSPSYLVRQARKCVNFTGALEAYQNHSLAKAQTTWIEIGPEPVCVGLARRTLEATSNRFLPTMKATEDNWVTISSALASLYQAGASIDWPQYYRPFTSSLSLLTLPTYAFDEKNYWVPYIERVEPPCFQSPESGNEVQKGSNATTPPSFSTTSLQWVEKEAVQGESVSVTFASRTSEPSLYEAIQGHVVNGVAVVSLSIFCDMAKSAARYAYEKVHPDQKMPNMTIYNSDMTHALVVSKPDCEQIIKTEVSFSGGVDAFINFTSTKGAVCTEHGSLRVSFEDTNSWFAQHSQTSFLVDARIQTLNEMSSTGTAHRLLKPVVYRLFNNLVSYGKNYQTMEEVWIDAQCRDAVGIVKLSNTTGAGNFLYNPFWADGAIHLAGFLVNSGLKYDEDIACLSTGFQSWHSLDELRADETYTTYTIVQDTERANELSGSAYVYNSEQKLVQVATGIRFQKMKKITLGAVLGTRPVASSAVATSGEKNIPWLKDPVPSAASSISAMTVDYFGFSERGGHSEVTTPGAPISTDVVQTLLSIVISECGCSETELEPGTPFSDIGLDSLMAITILATFRRKTEIELPPTFFLDHQTVAEAKEALLGAAPVGASPTMSDTGDNARDASAVPPITAAEKLQSGQQQCLKTEPLPPHVPSPQDEPTETIKSRDVILLHGTASSVGPNLFLLPDGGGSPSCYFQLPPLGPSLNVYALPSPFVKRPSEFTCSIEAICGSFVQAIRTVQPNGPYLLGGFSFGAVYAYETARMLGESGEVVEGLFVIDMAVPKATSQPTAIITQQQLAEAGILPSTRGLTATQKEHYVSTIRAMASYSPTASSARNQPKRTVLMFSKDGLAAGKRSDLAVWAQGSASASRGWEELISGPLERKQMDATHFALLRHPAVKALGNIWTESLTN